MAHGLVMINTAIYFNQNKSSLECMHKMVYCLVTMAEVKEDKLDKIA